MPRAHKPCSTPICPSVVPPGQSRCGTCQKAADAKRGTAAQRGYGSAHRRFRRAVLAAQPICALCRRRPSTHADHHPHDRRELVALGLNPNDPRHGRGLCASCDSRQTSERQPGGWNATR